MKHKHRILRLLFIEGKPMSAKEISNDLGITADETRNYMKYLRLQAKVKRTEVNEGRTKHRFEITDYGEKSMRALGVI